MKETLAKLAVVLISIFAPAKAMIISSLVLILADLITGVLAARKAGEPITSAGLRRTVSKLLIYETVIILGFLTEQYLTGPTMPVSHIIAGYIGLTELTSCIENLNILTGTNILKMLLDKINSKNS